MVLPNYAARRRGGRKQCAANVVLFIIAENPKNCKSNFVLDAEGPRSTKTGTDKTVDRPELSRPERMPGRLPRRGALFSAALTTALSG